ncbi:hypothetical protein [Caproicibacter sp.]|uniref:hypothetical protein n=1 Tax=Caproicibacter sp. TaxID=2814884 RepID=UPI003989962E
MRKNIWMINSLFAALLWIVTLFRMICYTQGFRAATEEAGRPLDLAYRLSELGFNVLFGLFLLFLGGFLAYGFARLRFVLPAVFTVLLISALTEFAFTPWSRAPWIFEGLRTIGAIFWCGAAWFAFWAAQKHGDNLRRKKAAVSAFSVLGVLLFFNSLLIQMTTGNNITIFQGLETGVKMFPIPIQSDRLFYLMLLFLAGWYTIYGFLRFRIVFPVTLGILLLPALTEFAFHPLYGPLSIFDGVLFAAGWLFIMALYRTVFRRTSNLSSV